MYENSPIITDFSLSSKPYFHWSYVILVVKKLSLKPSRAIMEAWLLQFEPSKDMIIDFAISFDPRLTLTFLPPSCDNRTLTHAILEHSSRMNERDGERSQHHQLSYLRVLALIYNYPSLHPE